MITQLRYQTGSGTNENTEHLFYIISNAAQQTEVLDQ